MDSQFARRGGARSRAPVDGHSSSGGELLHLPVCVDGAELGRPTDLLVDLDRLRVVGLNVRCDQGAERFLPLAALRSLRGANVDLAGRRVGTLSDIVLRSDGEVTRVVVRSESGKLRRLGAKHVRIGERKATR